MTAAVLVLIVEDESVFAQAHAQYVERTAGFEVAAVVRTVQEAMRALRADDTIALVLLDMNLPDAHGLAVLQQLRASGRGCDVIAVTAARDVEVVRQAVTQGVFAYLLKPFTYASFRAKLQHYGEYRGTLEETPGCGAGRRR
ncbi:response regulator [Yimella sp. cx-51]|uniref:response regulator n=1 Tax=Yimella sp. cx-51 TaxID=2770551 RepID=UPI00351C555B